MGRHSTIDLLVDRSTGAELNLSKFSCMRNLEKLQLRAVSGLMMAEVCSSLTDGEGLNRLKILVSAIAVAFLIACVTDVPVIIVLHSMKILIHHIIRVLTPPGKSWIFFFRIPGPGKS